MVRALKRTVRNVLSWLRLQRSKVADRAVIKRIGDLNIDSVETVCLYVLD